MIQQVMGKYLKTSHFYLQPLDQESPLNPPDTRKSSHGYHKDNHTYLKITNFDKKFNRKKIEELLSQAILRKNNLILDLRDNEGGKRINLMYLLSFFIPEETLLGYSIVSQYKPYLKDLSFSKNASPKEKLAQLIQALESNWDQPNRSFELSIKKEKESLIGMQSQYKIHKESNKEELQDMVFSENTFKGDIAILIDTYTASCSELATSWIKTLLTDLKVTIVGSHSSGRVICARIKKFPDLGISFTYPVEELISTTFERIEANPIKPDIYLTDPDEIMKTAEELMNKK